MGGELAVGPLSVMPAKCFVHNAAVRPRFPCIASLLSFVEQKSTSHKRNTVEIAGEAVQRPRKWLVRGCDNFIPALA